MLDSLVDADPITALAATVRESLESFYAAAGESDSIAGARRYNDALLRIGRELVPILYTRAGRFRQDPALDQPLLPDVAAAAAARASVPDGVARAELRRALNRIENALLETADAIGRCVPAAPSALV